MPTTQPSTTEFDKREDLGLMYAEFDLAMNRLGFIGSRLLPVISRADQSGKFPRVPIEQLLQNLDASRAPGSPYKRSTREWSNDDYATEEYGLEAPLDDRTLKRYDDVIDAELMEGEVLENALLQIYEKQVADLLFNATTFAGRTSAITNEWDDQANADPIGDVNTAINAIRLASGVKPNAVVMNDQVFRNVIRCDQVTNLVKYQGFMDARPGQISKAALAAVLNVDEVIVSEGIYNTKSPGETAVNADIWDDEYVLVARVATSSNMMERCIGRTFMWGEEGATAGGDMAVIAETYYEDSRRGNTIRRRTDWGLKMLQPECGYLLSNATT
ncbi:MAG: hypothetical protein AAGJ46_14415 [Planctomycetota bacterium]